VPFALLSALFALVAIVVRFIVALIAPAPPEKNHAKKPNNAISEPFGEK